MFRVCLLALLLWLPGAGSVSPARAGDSADFIDKFSGQWLGTGQLLFGPQFGTKFHCELNGSPSASGMTFSMKGRCWMGTLEGAVHAQLRYNAETNRFYGEFMDGADGEGVDIVGLRSGEGFTLKLSRGETQGKLLADSVGNDQITILLSVRDKVRSRDFPVIAMGFTRKEASAMGLPDYMPDPVTGSIGKAR